MALQTASGGAGGADGGLSPGRQWAALAVLALAVLLLAVDATVLNLALPALTADLAPSSSQLLWAVDVYSFVLAGLLVTMGNLGDRIGRRRLLLLGAAGFSVASLLAAWAPTIETFIAARALLGVAGATLMPSTLGLLRAVFPDPRRRTTAIGVWSAAAAGGAALGPVLGGVLLEHFWWGSVFLLGLPVMALLLLLGPVLLPEARDPHPGRLDPLSALLSLAAVLPVVYAVKKAAESGLQPEHAVLAAVGVACGVAFVQRQRQLRDPLVDVALFRRPAFSVAVATNLLAVFALVGVLFVTGQHLQLVVGLSPLDAGVALLPLTAAALVAALAAGALVGRVGLGPLLASGLVLAAAGLLLLTLVQVDQGRGLLTGALLLAGLGVGLTLTLTSDAVIAAVAPERAGAASAVSETAYELGTALGTAVLGSLLAAVYRGAVDVDGLPEQAAEAARDSIGGAASVATELPDPGGLLTSAQEAFVDGMHATSALGAALLLVAAVGAVVALRRPTR